MRALNGQNALSSGTPRRVLVGGTPWRVARPGAGVAGLSGQNALATDGGLSW